MAENTPAVRGIINRMRTHKAFAALICAALLSAAVYVVSRFSAPFAEFWARYPGQAVRMILAKISGVFPFSLAETLLVASPFLLIWIIAYAVAAYKTRPQKIYTLLRALISVLLVVAITFCIGFGPCYFRYSLAENANLTDEPVSGGSLYDTAVWLTDNIDALIPLVVFGEGGESHMKYSYYELVDRVNAAYENYAAGEDYISHFDCAVKPVSLSHYMTYTHISGVYAFFTGEANFNFNYPDFVVPYTVAHEMSHQRGIAREDEANFVAFLVCRASDDPYIRYSGYVSVLREVMSALYKADKKLYEEYRKNRYPSAVAKEMSAYSRFFDPYRESTAAKVVSATNDTYLKTQSVPAGAQSYGLVTDLAVAYYLTNIKGK